MNPVLDPADPPSDPSPPGGFRPRSLTRPAELFRDRPGRGEPYFEFANPEGFACFVRLRALRQMAAYGRAAGDRESIGRLGGRHCHDGRGPYVLVESATLTRNAHGTAGSIVADIAAQQTTKADFERQCRALDAVGWWHTHLPDVGLFFSETDRQNQATWADPNSIGIVLHPGLEREGLKVFRGPNAEELARRDGRGSLRRLLQANSDPGELTPDPAAAGLLRRPSPPMPQIVRPSVMVYFSSTRTRATIAMYLASAAFLLALLGLIGVGLTGRDSAEHPAASLDRTGDPGFKGQGDEAFAEVAGKHAEPTEPMRKRAPDIPPPASPSPTPRSSVPSSRSSRSHHSARGAALSLPSSSLVAFGPSWRSSAWWGALRHRPFHRRSGSTGEGLPHQAGAATRTVRTCPTGGRAAGVRFGARYRQLSGGYAVPDCSPGRAQVADAHRHRAAAPLRHPSCLSTSCVEYGE